MKTRVTTAIIFGIIIGFFIIPGFWSVHFIAPLLVLIAILAPGEFVNALKKRNIELNKINLLLFYLSFLSGLIYIISQRYQIRSANRLLRQPGLALTTEINQELTIKLLVLYGICIIILGLFSLFIPLLRDGPSGLKIGIYNIAAGLYISFPLFCGFMLLYTIPIGWFLFVLAITTPWICDSAALYCGMLWGKKKLAPKISPNKTMAGFYGGIIGTVIFYVMLYIFLVPNLFKVNTSVGGTFIIAALAIIISILTQLGDLLASSIKRTCNLKDFSNLMPGHGGIMDRFDSTFFTFTAILTIALLVYIF